MLSADIIVVLLSVLTIVIVPVIRATLSAYESALMDKAKKSAIELEPVIFEKTKQVILDYYSALDAQIDHTAESTRFLKDSITHLREVLNLKLDTIEKRLDNLEKK